MGNKFLRNAALLIFVIGLVVFEWRPWHNTVKNQPVAQQAPSSSSPSTSPGQINTSKPVVDATPTRHPEVVSDPVQSPSPQPVIRAQLSPLNYTTIAAEISAKVQTLGFREGESFRQGELLVTFDCAIQQAQLDKVRASLGIAERNYSTNKKLLTLGSVSRIETENAYSEYLKSKAELSELSAIVSKCKIEAPYSGRVVEQRVRTQQFAQPGQALLDILDSSVLELEFVAPSKWSTWLKPGYRFKIKIDEAGQLYPARVTRISPKIDPVSQTLKVAAVIDGDFAELTPGMSGTISIDPPETAR